MPFSNAHKSRYHSLKKYEPIDWWARLHSVPTEHVYEVANGISCTARQKRFLNFIFRIAGCGEMKVSRKWELCWNWFCSWPKAATFHYLFYFTILSINIKSKIRLFTINSTLINCPERKFNFECWIDKWVPRKLPIVTFNLD